MFFRIAYDISRFSMIFMIPLRMTYWFFQSFFTPRSCLFFCLSSILLVLPPLLPLVFPRCSGLTSSFSVLPSEAEGFEVFTWFSMTTRIFAQFLLICLYMTTWIYCRRWKWSFHHRWDSSKWVQLGVSTTEAETVSSKIDDWGHEFLSGVQYIFLENFKDGRYRDKERVNRSCTRQSEMLQRLGCVLMCPVFARNLSAL